MNSIALRQKMIEKHKSIKDLSIDIGISRSAIQRKLKGQTQFSQGELKTIISSLDLSDSEIVSIFFEDKVS